MASLAASQVAKTVIALVNDKMPRVLGTSSIHVSDVDYIVETSSPLPELHPRPASDVETAIGRYAADLVDDGSTLQLGLGGIPDAMLKYLEGKRDIGIHTEMVGDGLMHAVERGIITCRRKNYHPGKVCLTFVLGTRELYDYVHDNPLFEGHPVDWNNNPFTVARNDNMVAHQRRFGGGPHRPGMQRFDRYAHLLRVWRAGRFHPRSSPLAQRQTDHHAASHRQERRGLADCARAQRRRRRGHNPRGRALYNH